MAARQTILVATVGQCVMRSEDSGASWARVCGGLHSEAMVRSLLPMPGDEPRIYAATDRGLCHSEDAGAHQEETTLRLAGVVCTSPDVRAGLKVVAK